MNEFLKLILINIGKVTGIITGFLLAISLVFLGAGKTLFIIALMALGYFIGKWHDEGISIRRFLKDIIDSLRHHKWR